MTDRLAAQRRVYVYRLDVSYPEGSRYDPARPDDKRWFDWQPEGWSHPDSDDWNGDPDADFSFKWPVERMFLSRSAALRRVKRLEEYGAKAVIERSQEVIF